MYKKKCFLRLKEKKAEKNGLSYIKGKKKVKNTKKG